MPFSEQLSISVAGLHDMRWVELSDLIQLPKAEQKKITKFDKSFEQRMADRKQKVQEDAQ